VAERDRYHLRADAGFFDVEWRGGLCGWNVRLDDADSDSRRRHGGAERDLHADRHD
jgi:hypothetical protein